MRSDELVIWDICQEPTDIQSHFIMWGKVNQNPQPMEINLAKVIDANIELHRDEYLDYLYRFSGKKFFGKERATLLDFKKESNNWLLGEISEKANLTKSPEIYQMVQLFALKKLILEMKIQKLVVISNNKKNSSYFHVIAQETGIKFQLEKRDHESTSLSQIEHSKWPTSIKRILFLFRYYIERRNFVGIGMQKWKNGNAKALLISYSDNIVDANSSFGRFQSKYWMDLPIKINELNFGSNWMHLYSKDSNFPHPKNFANYLTNLNASNLESQNHVCLDSFLTKWLLLRAYLKTIMITLRVNVIRILIFQLGRKYTIEGLMHNLWKKSYRGVAILESVIQDELFNSAMENLRYSEFCIYLQENQTWEKSLIQAWRKKNFGAIVGYPHTEVVSWDFRYHFSRLMNESNLDFVAPDYIACSSLPMLNTFLRYPNLKDRVRKVESLRFQDLSDLTNFQKPSNKLADGNIVVLGDFSRASSLNLLDAISCAIDHPSRYQVTFKPHPNNLMLEQNPGIHDLKYGTGNLLNLIQENQVILSSPLSSSVYFGYFSNKKVIVYCGYLGFNSSPLRDLPDSLEAWTFKELRNLIESKQISGVKRISASEHFIVDKNLTNWSNLILEIGKK